MREKYPHEHVRYGVMKAGTSSLRRRAAELLVLCLLTGFSAMASETNPSSLYVAWTEPVAGGRPVISHSIYLASDGTLQHASFTDHGDLLKLESGNASAALFPELASLARWPKRSEKPATAVGEQPAGSSPVAVDFQAPQITVALESRAGGRIAESWPAGDLPPEWAPLVERARKLATRKLEPAHAGSYVRIEPAMVERTPDVALEASDPGRSAPLSEALRNPWRFVPARAPVLARGQTLTKELPLFAAFEEHLFLLRAYVLTPTSSGPSTPVKQ